ncbi:hypothetical protein CRYUN_Cryun22dG0095600 [Craigia yunnanensis]
MSISSLFFVYAAKRWSICSWGFYDEERGFARGKANNNCCEALEALVEHCRRFPVINDDWKLGCYLSLNFGHEILTINWLWPTARNECWIESLILSMKGIMLHLQDWNYSHDSLGLSKYLSETAANRDCRLDLFALDSISGKLKLSTRYRSYSTKPMATGQVVGDLMAPAPVVVRETTNLDNAARLLLRDKLLSTSDLQLLMLRVSCWPSNKE